MQGLTLDVRIWWRQNRNPSWKSHLNMSCHKIRLLVNLSKLLVNYKVTSKLCLSRIKSFFKIFSAQNSCYLIYISHISNYWTLHIYYFKQHISVLNCSVCKLLRWASVYLQYLGILKRKNNLDELYISSFFQLISRPICRARNKGIQGIRDNLLCCRAIQYHSQVFCRTTSQKWIKIYQKMCIVSVHDAYYLVTACAF